VDAGPWHDLLRRSPHSSIYQTSAWAAYLQEYLCHTPYYLRCDDEGMAMGVMLLTRQPLAASSLVGRPLGGAAATLLKKVAPRYSWTSGPVLFADEEPEACLAAGLLMDEARRIVGRSRVSGATMPVEMSEPVRSKCDAWLKATPWATFLVDLKPDETRLWESLRPAARKAVRRARESGLIVDVIQSDSARIELHAFLKEANELKGTRTFPIENLQIRNEHLSSIDGEVIYVARHKGQIAGSLGIWRFGGNLHEFGAAQAPFAQAQKLAGGDLLKWEVISREAAGGARTYDLCGVNPQPTDGKERGILQYKKKWGGRYIEYPVYHH